MMHSAGTVIFIPQQQALGSGSVVGSGGHLDYSISGPGCQIETFGLQIRVYHLGLSVHGPSPA